MTGFFNSAAEVYNRRAHDQRLVARPYRRDDDNDDTGYITPWWPRGQGLIGDYATDVGLLNAVSYGFPETTRGTSSRYGFVGVTRDAYGSPLAGVTVKCFKTSDDSLLSQVVSDENGAFTVTTPYYPDTHYLVCYKAGSPDVEGTTVNTLIGG